MSDVENALRVLEGLDPTSDQYKEVVARLLLRLDPNEPAGEKLCAAVMRFWTTNAFEAVAIRPGHQGPEVFLRQRAVNDTAYPGMWHVPGSLYRHGEEDRQVADRLNREFGTRINRFEYCGKLVVSEKRGTVHPFVFLVELERDPRLDDEHKWVPVSKLRDENMVLHHLGQIIPMALRVWQQRQSESIGW